MSHSSRRWRALHTEDVMGDPTPFSPRCERDAAGDRLRRIRQLRRIPGLVADLAQSKVDLILMETTRAAFAAKRVTSTVPIVMALVADPFGSRLAANLAHPGGNVTGLSMIRT